MITEYSLALCFFACAYRKNICLLDFGVCVIGQRGIFLNKFANLFKKKSKGEKVEVSEQGDERERGRGKNGGQGEKIREE